MPMFPTLERKDERKPISHELEQPERKAFKAHQLEPRQTPARPREEVWAEEFRKASDELSRLTPAMAVRQMETLPRYLLECYLLAEEVGQKRELILRRFPKPGHQARERYLPKPAKRVAKRGGKATSPDAQQETT